MLNIFEVLTVFFLGLGASFAPCLFPVLPSFVAFIAQKSLDDSISVIEPENGATKDGQSHIGRFNAFLASLLVTLGIMVVFIGLAFLFSGISGFFSMYYLQFRFYQGVLLVIFGILLTLNVSFTSFKVNEISAKAMNYIQGLSNVWVMSFLIGVLFALLAAPCGIVVFGTLFVIIGAQASIIESLTLVILFSVGAGVPFFIIAGLIPFLKDALLEQKGKIFQYLPRIVGIIVIGTGMFLMLDAINLGFHF
ncbi:MAG: cytochrome c biogenesis CcdA family protein [Candidatus Hodarchaeota archaeon]